ncbi:hypothetical protein [Streptomyces orinoci]|uniref:Uncharacterized protein n=1 Tax=Streptomyces orinoci TaxID=67339 RepID=A0ABV3JVU8_STRON|nr:hypothetical protein [Streptomyces orinoci]
MLGVQRHLFDLSEARSACGLKGDGVYWAISGVAHMHNLALQT